MDGMKMDTLSVVSGLVLVFAAMCVFLLRRWATSEAAADAALAAVRLGPVPQHVAFVMDGNRRFARRQQALPSEGHRMGFQQLEKTLDWCMRLGIQVVTVYAFSIENFKRPQEEVDTLMGLAEAKFVEFAAKSELVHKHGIAVRVLGDIDLLPPAVRRAACRAVTETRNNRRAILNICCPYTSQHEMLVAARDAAQGVRDGHILAEDICEETIEQCLFTGDCPPLDILVRTSGETRLSDFMLWQATGDCFVYFLNRLWPEFSFWDMLPILFVYQSNYTQLKASRRVRLEKSRIPPSPRLGHSTMMRDLVEQRIIVTKTPRLEPNAIAHIRKDSVSSSSSTESIDGVTVTGTNTITTTTTTHDDSGCTHSGGSSDTASDITPPVLETNVEHSNFASHRSRRRRLELFYQHVWNRRFETISAMAST